MPDDDPRLHAAARLLGHRLRDLRMSAGMSLTNAAERSGVSLSHLSEIERGTKLPSYARLLQLADFYGVLAIELLDVYPFGTTKRPRRLPDPPADGRARV